MKVKGKIKNYLFTAVLVFAMFICAAVFFLQAARVSGGCYYASATGGEPYTCVVTFDASGGSEVEPQTHTIGNYIEKPDDPERDGYFFDGWYSDENFTAKWHFEDAVIHDITLYAKWIYVCNITFETNGGGEVAAQEVLAGETVEKPDDPEKDDCVFVGWHTDAGLTDEWDFDNGRIYGDMILYAKWLYNCEVMFETYGAGDIEMQTLLEGDMVIRPDDPENDDCIFGGWYTDDSFTYKWDFDEDTVSRSMTLHAKWLYFYEVTFDTHGGSDVDPQTVVEGDKAEKPSDPEKDGYNFDGWYTDLSFMVKWDFEIYTVNNYVTIHAKWVLIINAEPPEITRQPQGGTTAVGGEVTLTAEAASTDGGSLTYQWYKNAVNSNIGGAAVPGETSDSYTVVADGVWTNYYYCVVTNTITDNGDGGLKTADAATNAAKVESTRLTGSAGAVMDGFTYDGVKTGSPSFAAAVGDWTAATYEYSANGTDGWSAAAPKNAGTYYIRALLSESESGHFYDLTTDAVMYTVAKANGAGSVGVDGWTAGGDANPPTVSGVPSEYGAPIFEYKTRGADDGAYTSTVPTEAGEYTVRARFAETANYNGYTTPGVDFTIEKATGCGSAVYASGASGGLMLAAVVSALFFTVKKKRPQEEM